MPGYLRRPKHRPIPSLLLAASLLAASGCAKAPSDPSSEAGPSPAMDPRLRTQRSRLLPLSKLPEVEPQATTQRYLQQLGSSTSLDENTAVHVKLPPPRAKDLTDSLVRVVGEPEDPQLLFRSDALVALGLLKEGASADTFAFLGQLDGAEVDRRLAGEKVLADGKFGKPTSQVTVFDGRTPVAVSRGLPFDTKAFGAGGLVGLNLCPLLPTSTEKAWGQSLFITAPAVVQDKARTWDPCTGAGTKGGAWTFAHLMREVAKGSGKSAEDFVLAWLEQWLSDVTVNGDGVAAREQMFHQVIRPWAAASGRKATLVDLGKGRRAVSLDGPLDLDLAPLRLLAIVNRLDLGGVGRAGRGSYGGGTTGAPTDAGELRFVFGVVQPKPWGGGTQESCGLKRFTVNLEYGVPITGCTEVAKWAREWTQLNTFGGFTTDYLTHLASLTERVVVSGAAKDRGNGSALKQLRTNENALSDEDLGPGNGWELREFTLTDEDPVAGTDTPSNGLLRPHTVAQTPDDGQYPSTGGAATDAFVLGTVRAGVPLTVGALPDTCKASYTVPYTFQGLPFRAGSSHMAPYAWESWAVKPSSPRDVCARHEFSLNTCNGCHSGETDTFFTHVNPESGIPATLSNFLTGGGAGSIFESPDWQYGTPRWRFAELDRRFQRLYDIAWCTQCTRVAALHPDLLFKLRDLVGVVPIDPLGPVEKPPFPVGAIRDLEQVKKVLELRKDMTTGFRDQPVDAIRRAESFVH